MIVLLLGVSCDVILEWSIVSMTFLTSILLLLNGTGYPYVGRTVPMLVEPLIEPHFRGAGKCGYPVIANLGVYFFLLA